MKLQSGEGCLWGVYPKSADALILDFPASRSMRNTFLLLMSYPSWCFVIATQVDWGITAELMAHNLITVLNQLLISFPLWSSAALLGQTPILDACHSSPSSPLLIHTSNSQRKGHSWGYLAPVYHRSPASAWFFMLPGNPTRLLSICFLFHHPSAHGNLPFPLSQQMIVSPHLLRCMSVGSRQTSLLNCFESICFFLHILPLLMQGGRFSFPLQG